MDQRANDAGVASANTAEIDVANRGSRRPRARAGPGRGRPATARARTTPGSGDDEWGATEHTSPGVGHCARPGERAASCDEGADELARAVAAGDARAALPLLIDRYGHVVYHYCRRMLSDGDDGDDVSQIVFLHAFEVIQRRQSIDNLRAYLLGIARYRCLDRLAMRRCAPILIDTEELERAVEYMALPDDSLTSDPRLTEALDEALDALEPRSRTVLLLRFQDGLSYAEISQVTGDRPGALRVRVARALRGLRRSLERREIWFEAPDTAPDGRRSAGQAPGERRQ